MRLYYGLFTVTLPPKVVQSVASIRDTPAIPWNEINRNFLPILQRTNGTCIFLHTYGNANNLFSLKQVCEKILVNVIKLNDSIWLTIYQFRLN